jgi:magnesium transporter
MEKFNISEILNQIDALLNEKKVNKIAKILKNIHAADISDILNHFPKSDDRISIFQQVEKEKWGEVLIEAEHPIQEEILEFLEVPDISEIINSLDSDDATDLIAEVDEEIVEEVLESVDEEQKEEVLELLNYPEKSAGGIMGKEFVSVEEHKNVNDIIELIREAKDEISEIYSVYVVDTRKHLLGRIKLKNLVLAKRNMTASDVMKEEQFFVEAGEDQEDVARIFEKYDLVELPVVNEKHQLLGTITIDDIIDVIEEEAQEDFSKMTGTRDEEIKEHDVFKIVKARLPWLLVALVAGMGSAFIMAEFDNLLHVFVKLAYFVPVVIAMGGNVGVQSSSIVIRGLATGEIKLFDLSHRIGKELAVTIYNSIIASIILFLVIFLTWNDLKLAFVGTISMIIAMIVAALVGASIPFLFKRIDIDPALASGPFVTTSNDIIGTLIYFAVAQALMV